MITRGTTPYHSFILPLSSSDIAEIYVTYLQNGEIILEKDKTQIDLVDINTETENGFITDENRGDSFSSNDFDYTDSSSIQSSCQATLHLTQEDTLGFTFYPAAEKNIAVIQIRILDNGGEAYASEPVRERIFGVLKDGVIPEGSNG